MEINEKKLEEVMGGMMQHMTGAAMCYGIWLGDELGFYRELAGSGPRSADSLAEATGCNKRLVREWLDSQAAGGIVELDSEADTYTLSPETGLALADDNSPVFLARGMNAIASMFFDKDKIVGAFKGDGGMSWGDHHPCLFKGTEWFFRTGYRAHLTTEWIPALEGVEDKLKAGARVADVGCGHGASVVVMAEAYPQSTFHGFDFHAASIETSRKRATEAGVDGRTTFAVADSVSYDGEYDLICFFDCLHDMGDPVGAAKHAKAHLRDGGAVLLVEPFAHADRTQNIRENPMAPFAYVASACVCTPNSLSQEVGLGLGAQAGADKLRQVFEQAGFKSFRLAAETPMNLIIEAKVG